MWSIPCNFISWCWDMPTAFRPLLLDQLKHCSVFAIIKNLQEFGHKAKDLEEPASVEKALKNVLLLVKMGSRVGNIDFITELPEDLPPVSAELIKLEQVFLHHAAHQV